MKNIKIKVQKIEKFGILRGNFPMPNPNQRWLTLPESRYFDPDPSLYTISKYENLIKDSGSWKD